MEEDDDVDDIPLFIRRAHPCPFVWFYYI